MKRTGLLVLGSLVAAFAAAGFAAARVQVDTHAPRALAAAGCKLKSAHNRIKHVIYIQFDNTHLLRDKPNVPSDLQQMPHLLNFIRGNGALLANDHTVLISHTATGILTSLTGLYSDRHGQAVANSYRFFRNDGSGLSGSSSSFK